MFVAKRGGPRRRWEKHIKNWSERNGFCVSEQSQNQAQEAGVLSGTELGTLHFLSYSTQSPKSYIWENVRLRVYERALEQYGRKKRYNLKNKMVFYYCTLIIGADCMTYSCDRRHSKQMTWTGQTIQSCISLCLYCIAYSVGSFNFFFVGWRGFV
jgi:hypothetical protein